MAAQPIFARHGSLVAEAAATVVTVTGDPGVIIVKNRGLADPEDTTYPEMWVTLNGDAPTGANGDDTACIEAGGSLEFSSANPGADVIRLYSTGAPRYSVEAYRP